MRGLTRLLVNLNSMLFIILFIFILLLVLFYIVPLTSTSPIHKHTHTHTTVYLSKHCSAWTFFLWLKRMDISALIYNNYNRIKNQWFDTKVIIIIIIAIISLLLLLLLFSFTFLRGIQGQQSIFIHCSGHLNHKSNYESMSNSRPFYTRAMANLWHGNQSLWRNDNT